MSSGDDARLHLAWARRCFSKCNFDAKIIRAGQAFGEANQKGQVGNAIEASRKALGVLVESLKLTLIEERLGTTGIRKPAGYVGGGFIRTERSEYITCGESVVERGRNLEDEFRTTDKQEHQMGPTLRTKVLKHPERFEAVGVGDQMSLVHNQEGRATAERRTGESTSEPSERLVKAGTRRPPLPFNPVEFIGKVSKELVGRKQRIGQVDRSRT